MLFKVNKGNIVKSVIPGQHRTAGEVKMENFVIVGKAKTVFKLIELKAKREEEARRAKKQNSKGK
ncbi:MAG: hypothetical protein A2Y92_01210 [Chloroflexi bacterium RBG_13_57_8]|nr:MAG: hypothetical protein A2Y92_01210 [Chloroflexi bacterium RBG_13_57_8]